MERNDPKSYWNYLKKLSLSKPAKTPTLNEFYDYFGNINSSNDAENININPNLDQTQIVS